MRTMLLALLLVAIPSLAAAQERTDTDATVPPVELQSSIDQTQLTTPDLAPVEVAPDRDVEARSAPADDAAAAQEVGSRQFWTIVLAVVVGGIIVAVLM